MVIFRVDERLVHGQIIEAWLPFTEAKHLIVANDAIEQDMLRQQIMSLAVPQHVRIHFVRLASLAASVGLYAQEKIFVVLENIQDLQKALAFYATQEQRDKMPSIIINIGNVHHGLDKQKVAPHVSLSAEEKLFLQDAAQKYPLDFRSVPSQKTRGLHDFLL